MPILCEIATVALNYANAASFTCAFRRWSGSTPSAWRDKHRRVAP
jgi:AraC-like DNA-binding protein